MGLFLLDIIVNLWYNFNVNVFNFNYFNAQQIGGLFMYKKNSREKEIERHTKRRRAIILRLYSGLTYEEISEILDIPHSTIFKWIQSYNEHLENSNIKDVSLIRVMKYNELQDIVNNAMEREDFRSAIQAIGTQIKLLKLERTDAQENDDENEKDNSNYQKLTKEQVRKLEEVLFSEVEDDRENE